MTEQNAPAQRRASLFDLRWIIAVLFGSYGVVVTIMGIGFTSAAELAKAGDVNVNLWTGIPMLVFAILFGLWALLRPLVIPAAAAPDASEPGQH